MVAVSVDSLESHQRFCRALGGYPFALVSDQGLEAARQHAVLGEDGRHSHPDAASGGGILLHQIPWFQPRWHRGQFMEIFRALGAIQGFE